MLSMTGFGRASTREGDQAHIEVELRSVNNRFLKVSCRLPSELSPYEPKIEERLRQDISRGTVSVLVRYRDTSAPPAVLDEALLESYRKRLDDLQHKMALPGEIRLDWLVTLPGVLSENDRAVDEQHWARVVEVLDRAVEALIEHRRAEGARLESVFRDGRSEISKLTQVVASRAPRVVEEYRQKLLTRVTEFLRERGMTIDDSAIIREVAIFADRSDIAEEISRLQSHLTHLDELLDRDAPVGRELDFLLQEMLREANTIGSKANDAELARFVVQIKAEIEKLKEQGNNIE
ncbi:MAG: YicC/YloC family endoribonuclease [Planctomycetota bacterium]